MCLCLPKTAALSTVIPPQIYTERGKIVLTWSCMDCLDCGFLGRELGFCGDWVALVSHFYIYRSLACELAMSDWAASLTHWVIKCWKHTFKDKSIGSLWDLTLCLFEYINHFGQDIVKDESIKWSNRRKCKLLRFRVSLLMVTNSSKLRFFVWSF